MQTPIPLGTVLQNRYHLTRILGQGGFGRTYLAEDQGRFNELCALKELIPPPAGDTTLLKSKELFQREASILYQIQHPQVPQFRATFEQDQRLFLVQDYVEGKTYWTLLDERKTIGQTFSETEVLQLFRQLLPVLAHLHSRGIIHRDISPDNIILRDRDQLPVLIDFGVVKELATRMQQPNLETPSQQTTVGKFGYAPSEQMQSGRVYPSSDLYSLAVTAIVLLTGLKPQELFDDTKLTWNWQSRTTVSPGFAQVLNRILSYKPGDRYQSVIEVVQALQALDNQTSASPVFPAPTPDASRVATLAVSRPSEPIASSTSRPNQLEPVIPTRRRSIWDSPWAIAVIALSVAAIAGVSSWALVNSWSKSAEPKKQAFPSPLVSESPTATPTQSATTAQSSPTPKAAQSATPSSKPSSTTPSPSSTTPSNSSKRLNLVPGENALEENGTLSASANATYTFYGEQGQRLVADLTKEGTLLTVFGQNDQPLGANAKRVTRFKGRLPYTGEYAIQLSPVQGVTQSKYQLYVRLENTTVTTPTSTSTSPTPISPTPSTTTPAPTPIGNSDTLDLNPNGTILPVSGHTSGQQRKSYVVNVRQGQVLSVTVQTGRVRLSIRNPNGQIVEGANNVLKWQSVVNLNGNYQIDVVPIMPRRTANFTLNVSARS